MFWALIPTEGKLLFAPNKDAVPTKKGCVNVTDLAPAQLSTTLLCSVLLCKDAV